MGDYHSLVQYGPLTVSEPLAGKLARGRVGDIVRGIVPSANGRKELVMFRSDTRIDTVGRTAEFPTHYDIVQYSVEDSKIASLEFVSSYEVMKGHMLFKIVDRIAREAGL